ncbi:MAG TPA: hypothetical protein VFI31_07620 [Pirellulales bacterium]|nr:hypothetical protein [Pirellulales bacterium]
MLLLLLEPARTVRAVSGGVSTSAAKGITLTVSTQWVDGAGYRPVEVAVATAAPLPADQTIHIELHARQNWYGNDREIAVSQDIELPAGSMGVVETIAAPQLFAFNTYNVEVWLNGDYSRKLSQPIRAFTGGVAFEGLPNVLAVGPSIVPPAGAPPAVTSFLGDPGSGALMSIFPSDVSQNQYGGITPPVAAGTAAPPLPSLVHLPLDRLPRRWLELSSLDLVCISAGHLEKLAAEEPERCQALRDWLVSGGNVVLYDVGPAGQRADEAARLLAPGASLAGGQVATEWSKPSAADCSNRLRAFGGSQPPLVGQAPTVVPDPPPFRLRRCGDGVLLAADTNDLFAQPAQDWIWMLNSLGPERWLWYRRHGLSLDRKNGDFWNWLVRGVGMAPVTEFRVLITAFVLAIGPLNYFWLRRRGRLHLLVIVVPLAAFTVTLALFAYALVADGLDVRVRARSITHLDQRTGHAVCWSRISYYAGLAPSAGLAFPDDVVVLPLAANDGDVSEMPRRQNVIWSNERQDLVSGWLPSRTPTQLLTVRSRNSQAGLRYIASTGASGPQIENQLGSRIIHLVATDEQGNYFAASDVAPGATVTLVAVEEPGKALEQYVADHKPGVPEGFVQPSSYGFSGRRAYYRYYAAMNNNLPAPSFASSRLETDLRDVIMGPGTRSSAPASKGFSLAANSYVAIVERSPEVVLGIDQPREEDSLHVVVGKW